MIANTEVLERLGALCRAADTGTFFITTTDNKACHIVLDEGHITAMSFASHRGEDVISQLPFIKVAGFSFKPQMKMPLSSRAAIDDGDKVLAALGLHHPDNTVHHSKRMYRGTEIEETPQPVRMQKPDSDPAAKKPVRMYRGHKLED